MHLKFFNQDLMRKVGGALGYPHADEVGAGCEQLGRHVEEQPATGDRWLAEEAVVDADLDLRASMPLAAGVF